MNGGTNFRGRETGVMVCFAIANLKRRPRAQAPTERCDVRDP